MLPRFFNHLWISGLPLSQPAKILPLWWLSCIRFTFLGAMLSWGFGWWIWGCRGCIRSRCHSTGWRDHLTSCPLQSLRRWHMTLTLVIIQKLRWTRRDSFRGRCYWQCCHFPVGGILSWNNNNELWWKLSNYDSYATHATNHSEDLKVSSMKWVCLYMFVYIHIECCLRTCDDTNPSAASPLPHCAASSSWTSVA